MTEDGTMKRAMFFLASIAIIFVSCNKEILENTQEGNEETVTDIVFELTANHPGDQNTKAVKTGWENGDVIFVFFNNVDAPKYLKMSYDGSEWSSIQMNGSEEGSLGLEEGATGSMRAVFLPFGNKETVSVDEDGTSFKFGTTYNAYYLTATLNYIVKDGKVSGAFNMKIPEGYVQFFLVDEDASSSVEIELREPHLTPMGVASVAADGTITDTSVAHGAPLKGYVYDGGYLFSGILAEGARNKSTTYHFTLVSGGWQGSYYAKEFEGKTWYRGESEGRALKMPALTGWTPITDYKPIDLGIDVDGKRVYWSSRNLGATADIASEDSDEARQASYGDFFAWGETEVYYTSGAYDQENIQWVEGKESGYSWASYTKFTTDGGNNFSKYNATDDKAVLDPEDDAATAHLHGVWRTPTDDEWNLLKQKTNMGWDATGHGYHFTSKESGYTDRSIFIPGAGNWSGTSYGTDSKLGVSYWSSTLRNDSQDWPYPRSAWRWSWQQYLGGFVHQSSYRHAGYSIRPVTD